MPKAICEQLHKEMLDGTPRYLRAKRFADSVMHVLHDFLPQERHCFRLAHEHLMEVCFEANMELAYVDPARDALEELTIKQKMASLDPLMFMSSDCDPMVDL